MSQQTIDRGGPAPDAPRASIPWREKFTATAVHLLLSAIAVGLLLLVATLVWYPGALFSSDGGWQGMRIVVLVDLILGPALTFVVYRRGKVGLAKDLGIIAAIQVAAFVFGASILWSERPIALVFVDGTFYSVSPTDFDAAGVEVPDLSGLPDARPHRVYVHLPADFVEQNRIRAELMKRRRPVYTYAEAYRPLTPAADWILDAALTPAEIAAGGEAGLGDWLARLVLSAGPVAIYPYISRFGLHFMALDRASLEVLGVIEPAPDYRFVALPIRTAVPPAEPADEDGGTEDRAEQDRADEASDR